MIQRITTAAILAGYLFLLTGCGKTDKPKAVSASPAGSPAPSATPTPLPIAATASDLTVTLFGTDGKTAAKLSAKGAVIGTRNGSAPEGAGTLKNGTATLYKEGKPAATLTADTLTADRKTQIIHGKGKVQVRSLTQKGAPAIQADEVTWKHGSNKIVGTGNVLITLQNPVWKMPGDRFEADTEIQRFRVYNNSTPTTGSF